MLSESTGPLPWYIAGPLIGLIVPLLLVVSGKRFGLSSNLSHLCSALPTPVAWKPGFLRYDWRRTGGWNLVLALGIVLGGALSVWVFGVPDAAGHIADATREELQALGVRDFSGMAPAELFAMGQLGSPVGLAFVVLGGLLVGFGTRYADGCTSGHAISGLASLQLPSLVAVVGFFAGGLILTHGVLPVILPLLLRATP